MLTKCSSSLQSGSTVTTLMNLFDQYPLKAIGQAIRPYALSPVPNDHQAPQGTFLSAITGQRTMSELGRLSTSATGPANAAIMFRTWGLTKQEPSLKEEFYGPNFTYREFMNACGFLKGVLMHYSLLIGAVFVLLPPFRALIKRAVFKPGDGPDREKTKSEIIEFRAVAKPDVDTENRRQILGRLQYTGSMYYLTAALLAQAARTMLEDTDDARLTGGICTPACLGGRYINHLEHVGLKFTTEVQHL
ncbi:uncharacterized protein A1O9_06540 [Exophiala aquamarina CBS 119918]|uniref:Saccharopine dehydrogenase-like C-terminal domain-containing protein n=1 Tax=Exophiala aquamarina CBS 119918 TaxID=1182545 RepID=A0A072PER7_9EURO|nr:uncharacterized protein A1O9_06540 [Exophiala aquamarina CBS 119918]KEF58614.1 hypothetical protein A1O9_06540 [Exophiala aquamarina CBS 119918]